MTSLFWMFVLAHLLGDYPLQTDWLVSVKRTWWGLSLHVGIHLLMLIVLSGRALPILWPYLLVLAVVHYAIDSFKNWLSRKHPHRVNGPYIFDQFLHLLSMILVAAWVQTIPAAQQVIAPFFFSTAWTALLIGLLFCTVVWYISERVLTHATPAYQREVIARRWPRICVRAALFFLVLWLGEGAGLVVLPLFVLPLAALPYPCPTHRTRAVTTDVAVAIVAAALVVVAN